MASKTTRSSDQFILRFPEGMRELIAQRAKENGRSMNAEIIDRMESSFMMDEHHANIEKSREDNDAYMEYMLTDEYKNKSNADSVLRIVLDIISLSVNMKKGDDLWANNFGEIYKPLHNYIYKEFDIPVPVKKNPKE